MFRPAGRLFCSPILLSMSLLTPLAAAQETAPLGPGSQVRVYAFCATTGGVIPCRRARHEGTIVRVDADSLVLAMAPDSTRQGIPVPEIARLDAHQGRRSMWRPGALIGALAGLAAGSVIGYVSYPDGEACGFGAPDPCPQVTALAGAVLGAAGGALIGGVVGSQFESNRWEPVDVGRLQVGLGSSHRGARVGLAVRF